MTLNDDFTPNPHDDFTPNPPPRKQYADETKKPESKSLFDNFIFQPLTTAPSKLGRTIGEPLLKFGENYSNPTLDKTAIGGIDRFLKQTLPMYGGAFAETLGDTVSGLTTPVNIASMAAPELLASKAAPFFGPYGKAIAYAGKGANAAMVGEGAHNALSSDKSLLERVLGVAEMAGGVHGFRGSKAPVSNLDYKLSDLGGIELPKEVGGATDTVTGKLTNKDINPDSPLNLENVTNTPKPAPRLPNDLRGAQPRFNMGKNGTYTPLFDNDIDKSLFIIAQDNLSKRDADYLKFVMNNTGLNEVEARTLGRSVKKAIKNELSGKDPGAVNIPRIYNPSAPKAVPKLSPIVENSPLSESAKMEPKLSPITGDTTGLPKLTLPEGVQNGNLMDAGTVKQLFKEDANALKDNGTLVEPMKGYFRLSDIKPQPDPAEAARLKLLFGDKADEFPTLSKFFTGEEGSLDLRKLKKSVGDLFRSDDDPKVLRRAIVTNLASLDARGVTDVQYKNLLPRELRNVPLKPNETFRSRVTDVMNAVAPPVKGASANIVGQPIIDKLLESMRNAKVLGEEQQTMRTAELGRRFGKMDQIKEGGIGGYFKRLSKLSGPMPQMDFDSINLNEKDIENLFDLVDNNPNVGRGTKLSASSGLKKILGYDEDARIPQNNELDAMSQVLGQDNMDEMTKYLHAGIPLDITKKTIKGTNSLMKELMSGWDASGIFRQGLGLAHTGDFWKNIPTYFKAFGDGTVTQGIQDSIRSDAFNRIKGRLNKYNIKDEFRDSVLDENGKIDPSKITEDMLTKPLSRKNVRDAFNGLSLTDVGDMSNREELFMNKFVEKYVPGVKRSNNAYVAFLNKTRFDVYKKLENQLGATNNPYLRNEIAQYVNNATGRGSFGSMEKYAGAMNQLFFSPRMQVSRINMIKKIFDPSIPQVIRWQYLKSLIPIIGGGVALGQLSKAGGAEVSIDGDSPDFMKIKVGDTRIDPFAGWQQPAVLLMQLWDKAKTSTISGKQTQLNTGKFGAPTWLSTIESFGRNKMSPLAGLTYDALKGTTPSGDAFELRPEIMDRMMPMVFNDIAQLYQSNPGLFEGVMEGAAGISGIGLQTYGNKNNLSLGKLIDRNVLAPIGDAMTR